MFKIRSIIGSILLFLFAVSAGRTQVLGVEIMDGKSSVTIPFKYSYGFILVDFKLNNILPLKFIFDTGAEHTILFKKEISDILGFEYEKKINLVGSDLEREVFALISRKVPMTLKGTKTVDRDLIVLEDDFLNLESMVGESIDGILGSRFFRGLVIHIDYTKQKLILYDKSNYRPPNDIKKYIPIDLTVENHKPYLNTTITTLSDVKIPVKLLLDTGAALPFLLFLETHPSLTLPEHFIRGNLGRGLGGELEGYLGKIKELKLADEFIFRDFVTSFQQVELELSPEVYRKRNGLIGNPVLSRFHIILDLIDEKAYFKPKKNYNKKFEFDKSGLIIYAFGPDLNRYYVKDVLENSPAAEGGIQKGDIIKRVGILPSYFYSLGSISQKLHKKEGKKVRLTVLRNGINLRKTVVLRELIPSNKPKNIP